MMTLHRQMPLALTAVLVALVVGGCGGEDESTPNGGANEPSTSESAPSADRSERNRDGRDNRDVRGDDDDRDDRDEDDRDEDDDRRR